MLVLSGYGIDIQVIHFYKMNMKILLMSVTHTSAIFNFKSLYFYVQIHHSYVIIHSVHFFQEK